MYSRHSLRRGQWLVERSAFQPCRSIHIEYDRLFINTQVQEIVARSAASLNVLAQLGAAYQGLPGLAMAGYQTEADALETALASLNALIDQIRVLLISIDAMAGPLSEKNKKLLGALRGLLQNAADLVLLDQITGPTPQPAPPPPPVP